MATGYVVVQVGYDYNDEIYYRSESGGGTPTKVYLDYAKANAEVSRLNMEELLTCEIGQYAYDLEDIVSDMDEFEKILRKYDTDESLNLEDSYELGEWFSSNVRNFTKEDQEKVLGLISLEFYELAHVEIDNSIVTTKNSGEADSNRFNV